MACMSLPGLKRTVLPGGDANFLAGLGIAPDTGLARPDLENAEAAQFNALTACDRVAHGVEDRLDGDPRQTLAQARALDHAFNEVRLNHGLVWAFANRESLS